MGLKRSVKRACESLFGVRIVRDRPDIRIVRDHELLRGVDLFVDIKTALPRFKPLIVFDIGANVGQSALQYHRHFPEAVVHSFEPISATFKMLQKNARDQPNQHCHQMAMAAAAGSAKMRIGASSELSHLLAPGENVTGAVEEVAVSTVDLFCSQHAIVHIDYLKIDTEGHDLEVLKGAASLLAEQRIGIVEVEAGMNPANSTHVPLEHLKPLLESHGYLLFGIYEQVHEFPTRQPNLRRTNLVFISPQVIAANRMH